MVDERITDPRRVAQILASELTGLETGPLAAVTVLEADSSATPSESGARAYRIAFDETPVGSVWLYPDSVAVVLEGPTVDDAADVAVAPDRLELEDATATKRAVDALRAALVDR